MVKEIKNQLKISPKTTVIASSEKAAKLIVAILEAAGAPAKTARQATNLGIDVQGGAVQRRRAPRMMKRVKAANQRNARTTRKLRKTAHKTKIFHTAVLAQGAYSARATGVTGTQCQQWRGQFACHISAAKGALQGRPERRARTPVCEGRFCMAGRNGCGSLGQIYV